MIVQTANFGDSDTFKADLNEGKYNYPMHLHQYAEIVYVYEGSLELTTTDRIETVRHGDFAVLMPFQAHKLYTPKYCKVLICVFSDTLLSEFKDNNALIFGEQCVFTPTEATRNYVLSKLTFKTRFYSCTNEHICELRSIKAAVFALAEEYFSKVKISKHFGANDMLSKMLLYIHGHYTENITLAKMAQSFGYNPNYISHCFKSVMGMNFCSFINCIRVEKAKSLLADKSLTADEISAVCGFSCQRNYYRAFKAVTGKTPAEYRRV